MILQHFFCEKTANMQTLKLPDYTKRTFVLKVLEKSKWI
jgi:hypothetical protein